MPGLFIVPRTLSPYAFCPPEKSPCGEIALIGTLVGKFPTVCQRHLGAGGIDAHPAPPSSEGQAAKAVSANGASAFRLPAASAGGAFAAHPACSKVSHLGRSDHSAPQRADRANFSEGATGKMPVMPEQDLGGRDNNQASCGTKAGWRR